MSVGNTHIGARQIGDLLATAKRIFFIGVGGVSMSSLAHITKMRGFEVAGSDRKRSRLTERLEAGGITVFEGHAAENVEGFDAVVYTLAIGEDNPEYVRAQELRIPVISRADYLGYVMTGFERRLGISGMHGKSSCTGMCAAIFMAAETDPTVVSGAEYPAMGGFYRVGNEKNFIFEACEYKDSFLDFNPTDAIILNIELEHVDYFPSLCAVCDSFAAFAALTEGKGRVFANADDENVMRTLEGYGGDVVTFGVETAADFTARNVSLCGGKPSFSLFCGEEELCRVEMRVPGLHSVYNALAASCAAYAYGIPPEAIARGLSEFRGIRRRMEYRGQKNGAAVYDDYGHHPTEIAATLRGARELAEGRLICAFQPHTYSRTKALFDDFAAALSTADRVLLAPIYAAREPYDPAVSSAKLASAIGDKAVAFDSVSELSERAGDYLESGDVLVVMGAGDIDAACDIIKYDGENK